VLQKQQLPVASGALNACSSRVVYCHTANAFCMLLLPKYHVAALTCPLCAHELSKEDVVQWMMHLVIGGSEKQLAQIMKEAEADLDELITNYSRVSYLHCLTAAAAQDHSGSKRA